MSGGGLGYLYNLHFAAAKPNAGGDAGTVLEPGWGELVRAGSERVDSVPTVGQHEDPNTIKFGAHGVDGAGRTAFCHTPTWPSAYQMRPAPTTTGCLAASSHASDEVKLGRSIRERRP